MATISPQTIGQHLDAVLASAGATVHTDLAKAETAGEKAWNWIKGEWHNVITMVSVAYMALKASGKL